MKKSLLIIGLIISIMVSCAIMQPHDTYADTCVEKASVYWAPGMTWWDDDANYWHVNFSVTLTYGSSCNGWDAGWDYFHCNDGGADLDEWGGDSADNTTGGGTSTNIETKYWGIQDGYEWREVYITPPNSNWQPVFGWIRKPINRTLTGVAVDKSGNDISGIANVSTTVSYGSAATITRRTKDGWTFLGWRTNKTSGNPSGSTDYSVSELTSDQTVYAVYEYKSFKAEAKASDVGTGYVDEGTARKVITCNNISTGCEVTFTLNMKKPTGTGSTTYSISKRPTSTTNYESVLTNQTFSPSDDKGQTIATYKETIKPNQSFCYRITYHPYGSYSADTAKNVTACAYANGTFTSSINLKVKQNSGNFKDEGQFYAKPGDNFELLASYTPTAQYVAKKKSKKLTVGNKTDTDTTKANSDRFKTLTNTTWVNEFTVQFCNYSASFSGDDVGSTATYTSTQKNNGTPLNCQINSSHVGKSLTAVAKTNANLGEVSPKESKLTYENNVGFTATVDPSSISSNTFSIIIPYNFELSTTIGNEDQNNNEKKVVYAGESMDINYTVTVNPRKNEVVRNETYSTIVRNAKSKIQIYSGGEWADVDGSEKEYTTMNETENPGDDSVKPNATVTIPDVPAGSKICLQSLVYPKDSGNDTNLNSKYYDESNLDNWAFSGEKCFVVAKKPSLQVWGGNIYSSGEIDTSTAAKTIDGNLHTFGSWGELGIISGGAVTGMASGAGYGYPGPNSANNPGGAKGNNFCEASPLSFANNDCQNKETGSLDISFGGLSNDSDFITQALADENANIRNRYSSFSDFKSDFNDGEIEIDSGTVFISNPGEVINIDKDIKYTGNYTSLDSMPKVVIYAKNVNIFCNVSRIDALIIAETVKTCSNGGNINSKDRSNQLIINGAIIAKELEAGRTYGAGAGTDPETGNNYSIIPAEIINFDPSLYLWGKFRSETDPSKSLKTTYSRELPPRF